MKPMKCARICGSCICHGKEESYDSRIRISLLLILIKKFRKNNNGYKALLSLIKQERAPWFINSLEHDFCFWSYIEENHEVKHTLQECAILLDISISAVANTERKALKKLRKNFKKSDFMIRSKTE